MKVLAFCGSLRRVSMNAALLRVTARLAPAGMAIELFDGLGSLPLFNPELEADMPFAVTRMHRAIDTCDALLIASPEYAHGVTGALKNALDWLVSFEGFVHKPVAIFNASPRSVHADAALREILLTMSARLITAACLDLPLRGRGLDEAQMAGFHGGEIRDALRRFEAGVRST